MCRFESGLAYRPFRVPGRRVGAQTRCLYPHQVPPAAISGTERHAGTSTTPPEGVPAGGDGFGLAHRGPGTPPVYFATMKLTVTPAPQSALNVVIEVPAERFDHEILDAVRILSRRTRVRRDRMRTASRIA